MQLKQISWFKWQKILMSRVVIYPTQLHGEAEKGQSFEGSGISTSSCLIIITYQQDSTFRTFIKWICPITKLLCAVSSKTNIGRIIIIIIIIINC
ncbi:hypothetical protein IEQ34_017961 [Dendrobium chrysotoxum]|uniref:Uncharacterized protein n=1 Tax=Dendrobium chrysotoxum TaxID=161865 RepID=A0AAV7GCX2_DENCH|nr:hypothetical protein IEQ34_017961 [Dendrobium chrysotoxum]